MSTTLAGRGAAPGAALAPAFVVEHVTSSEAELPEHPTGTPDQERARFDEAVLLAAAELRELAVKVGDSAGQDEGEIFEAHAEFAADPELARMVGDAVAAGAPVERSVVEAFGTFRDLLAASASEYLAARAADLDDVRDRIVAILLGRSTEGAAPLIRSVIVARELTPSQTASMPLDVIAGIVTETGSPTSHAAILARALGVPAVVACQGLLELVAAGGEVGLDGRTGEVVIAPTDVERGDLEGRIVEEKRRRDELSVLRDEHGRTADGHHVEIAANIGSIEHIPMAVEAGGQGSGLVRTEFLFLDRTEAPTVEEQTEFYAEVLRGFPGERVVFRTLDVGADKPLPFVEREAEENPALGLRGIRLSLLRPELFRDQLRALLRARERTRRESAGRMAVMFPLVSSARELVQARATLEEIATDEGSSLEGIEVGVMIEVPAAAIDAERLARYADFLSIGTNDLLQYLYAADRLNGAVADLPDVLEPAVLALLGRVVEAGHANGAWVGVCGEAAGDPTVAVALIGLGVDELSMTRVGIPEVKDALRRVTLAQCREAAEAAIADGADAHEVRHLIEERLK